MRQLIERAKPKARKRLKPDERRKLLVEAAFMAVARQGFEGLRTRDIARSVGINSATLHHYFATKEDLIVGIAEHLKHRLGTERSPRPESKDADLLGQEFEDLIFYRTHTPELLGVYREFVARAPRDKMIRRLVEKLHEGWKASVVTALERARARGDLRIDIDLEATANLVLSAAWGLVAGIFRSPSELRAAALQLRSGLVPQSPAKTRKRPHEY